MEKPIADIAAAVAYIQYGCSGTIGMDMISGAKWKVQPQTLRAKRIPNAIPIIIMTVLIARSSPIRKFVSNISSTKLMSGTPGTMNNAQAKSGCNGVDVQAGR